MLSSGFSFASKNGGFSFQFCIFLVGKMVMDQFCPNFYEEPIDLGIPMGTICFFLAQANMSLLQ